MKLLPSKIPGNEKWEKYAILRFFKPKKWHILNGAFPKARA